MIGTITTKPEVNFLSAPLRRCTVNGEDALFHRWSVRSNVVPPSPMVGGAPGGTIQLTMAIIEYVKSGQVAEVVPEDIVFCDSKETWDSLDFLYLTLGGKNAGVTE